MMPTGDPGLVPDGGLRRRVFARYRNAIRQDSAAARWGRALLGWIGLTVAAVLVGLLIPMRQPGAAPPDDSELTSLVRMHDLRARAFAGWMSAQRKRGGAPIP